MPIEDCIQGDATKTLLENSNWPFEMCFGRVIFAHASMVDPYILLVLDIMEYVNNIQKNIPRML